MYSVWVTLEVKPEHREEFLRAIKLNAEASVRDEPGCHRFDVLELSANHFAFYELYRNEEAFEIDHKQSQHFLEYQEEAARVVVPDSQKIATGALAYTFNEPQ